MGENCNTGETCHCYFGHDVEQDWLAVAGLHVVDHHLPEAGAADLGGALHQAGKVVGNFLALDGFFHGADDQVGAGGQAHVAQHPVGRQDL
jgi:hypothetical protein